MSDLFVEFYSEEIPSRMQEPSSKSLKEGLFKALNENRFSFGVSKEYFGPKRISINIKNVSPKQLDVVEEKRGPRADANDKAIDGFAKSLGVSRNELKLKKTPKGDFLFYLNNKKGKTLDEEIPKIIINILKNFPWPKSQKWGSGSLRWVRPLKSVCVLYNNKSIKFEISNNDQIIENGNFSYGHSFVRKKKIFFKNQNEYEKKLKANYVLVDPILKRAKILEQFKKISKKNNFFLINDKHTLDEVCGLVEWPNSLVGKIDESFMSLPREVLMTVMKVHQKYFAVEDASHLIQPYFVFVSNMPTKTSRDKNIILGNEKVLRSRLQDAKFFWESDRSKTFSSMLEDLKKVSYFKGLGSLYDKSKRIEKISDFISKEINISNVKPIKRAALLCKVDLLTGMVGEFPELQGIMGGYYSSNEGKDVSDLIRSHYLPKGSSGEVSTNTGVNIISLSDKIDHLVGFFIIGQLPSGSKDPFGLRRSALSIIRVLIEGNILINLDSLIEFTSKQINKKNIDKQKIKSFIIDRYKVLLREKNIKYDVINCLVDNDLTFLSKTNERLVILNNFLDTKEGNELKLLWQRVSSILHIEEKQNKKIEVLNTKMQSEYVREEVNILNAINNIEKTHDYLKMLSQRSSLKDITFEFFENLKINDSDPLIKNRRLSILALLREKLLDIGDLRKLEGS